MYLGSSPSPPDTLRQIRHSRYAAAFLSADPFAQFWLHDLRHHTALALIMARASAAATTPAALTRRGVSDLANLSMSAVHALLADACTRGDFSRGADAGDRRRVMLIPAPATVTTFTALVRDFLLAASGGEPLSRAVAEAAAQEPQVLSLYARFACALVAARRPGGRLWVEPASLAMLADLMTGGREGIATAALRNAATRRGQRGTLEGDLAFAAMAGLAEPAGEGRVRLSQEGRNCVIDHLEIWRSWTAEARLVLAHLATPMSTRVA